MPNPEIPIAFIETFPLLVCPECKAEFVIIYWYGESGWGKQISTYYCPYCGKNGRRPRMPEVIMPVEWVEIDMICDKCGKGKMRSDGRTFTVNPPIFPHVCNKCGYEADYRTCYPHTGYTRKEIG